MGFAACYWTELEAVVGLPQRPTQVCDTMTAGKHRSRRGVNVGIDLGAVDSVTQVASVFNFADSSSAGECSAGGRCSHKRRVASASIR